MPRPKTKDELIKAAEENYQKLLTAISDMTEEELATPFDFSGDAGKKEAHWGRDKNLRDVLAHLWEWHGLLIKWFNANVKGKNVPFLSEPYNWKTYGDMNVEFWKKHQKTELCDIKNKLQKSHNDILELIKSLSDDDLFTKGKYPWVGGSVLGSYFISTTSSHYDWAIKKLKAHKKNCKE
ncbi:MAG: ClbS/DfsB family four-helix bundle protein [Clostridia bacterium]|nr:ClbS/DfsB family four-helix bundle protein [Clostridia bacterium]